MTDSVLLKDWHPLDGVPAPDYVPPVWDGPHVGKRLVEALRILRRMPMNRGPRMFGNAWPGYMHEWEDLLAQQTRREEIERAQNRTRVLPSSIEITAMEAAIVWPARYLAVYPQLVLAVGVVAVMRASYRDIEEAARKLDLPDFVVRRWNREGLDTIAHGLRVHEVAIT
jgi:hypothetical protein